MCSGACLALSCLLVEGCLACFDLSATKPRDGSQLSPRGAGGWVLPTTAAVWLGCWLSRLQHKEEVVQDRRRVVPVSRTLLAFSSSSFSLLL